MAETLFKLRSDKFASMTVTAASPGYTAGQMIKETDTAGVIVKDAATGKDAELVYKAEKILVPCAAGATGAYAVGAKVYFDETNAEVTETASSNTLCGIVVEQPDTGAEEVLIDLDGTLGIVS